MGVGDQRNLTAFHHGIAIAERWEDWRCEADRSGAAGKPVAPEPPAHTRPDMEVVPSAKRGSFTAEYKLGILTEIDASGLLVPAPSKPCCPAKA